VKKISLIFLFLIMLCTTGCVKYSYNIEIDDKDNILVSEIDAVNLNFIKSLDPNAPRQIQKDLDKDKHDLEKNGYIVENYSDETYTGLKRLKKYILPMYSTEDLPDGFSTTQVRPILKKKEFLKNTYIVALKYDINKISNKNMGNTLPKTNSYNSNYSDSMYINGHKDKVVSKTKHTDPITGKVTETVKYQSGATSSSTYNPREFEQFSNSMGNMLNSAPGMAPVADLTIKIPKEAKEHNANEVTKNHEYKWNLASDKPVEINLKYVKTNWFNIIIVLFSIIFSLFVIIAFKKNIDSSSW